MLIYISRILINFIVAITGRKGMGRKKFLSLGFRMNETGNIIFKIKPGNLLEFFKSAMFA